MRLLWLMLCLVVTATAAPLSTDTVYATMVRWEGHKVVPYRDQDGWSVGVGHALSRHGEPVKRAYTRAEVYRLFVRDYAVSLEICRAGVSGFDGLPEDVRLVCLNVAWGCGPSGFMAFKDLRRSLSRRAYTAAATSLYLSRWYQQVSPARANWAVNTLRSY